MSQDNPSDVESVTELEMDVADPEGRDTNPDDERLEEAISTLEKASQGITIPPRSTPRKKFDDRIREAEFVGADPSIVGRDMSIPFESVPMKEVESLGDVQFFDRDVDEEYEEMVKAAKREKESSPVSVFEEWVHKVLTVVHEDLQDIKSALQCLPSMEKSIKDIQESLSMVAAQAVENNNGMSNIQDMIANHRIEMSKLSEAIKTKLSISPQADPTPKTQQEERKILSPDEQVKENNILKIFTNLQRLKNLPEEADRKLRYLYTVNSKDLIITTLNLIGLDRPPTNEEIETLIKVDLGSGESARATYKVLLDLLKVHPAFKKEEAKFCPGPCSTGKMLKQISRGQGGIRKNPFAKSD